MVWAYHSSNLFCDAFHVVDNRNKCIRICVKSKNLFLKSITTFFICHISFSVIRKIRGKYFRIHVENYQNWFLHKINCPCSTYANYDKNITKSVVSEVTDSLPPPDPIVGGLIKRQSKGKYQYFLSNYVFISRCIFTFSRLNIIVVREECCDST
uniref:Uncharacterized protein n=1 Tax=Heterorhabditis bacteriophora TaxID=37862 RepID=A0A1I7WHD8_HETBA